MTPFICAEMSANHLGSLSRALEIVEAAAEAGADAIKVQSWSPGSMCVSDYIIDHGPWAGRKLRDLYAEAELPWDWHSRIFDRARLLGLIPFSAAFDRESVDFLESLGVDRHKVASFELTDLPLIRYMASKGKPMIVSTGMATKEEIERARLVANQYSMTPPTLLCCTSAYPADPAEGNIAAWPMWQSQTWGLSDHTMGWHAAVCAVARGATYIEKHLTLARADGGPDAGFSSEPHEFAQMVVECRRAAAAIGKPGFGPRGGETPELRRSLWVVRDTPRGAPLVLGENVRTARPALGLPCDTPLAAGGRSAARDLRAGEPLTAECLS
jgi:sialic acid synthase SpsE